EAGYDTVLAGWTVRSAVTWLAPQADGEVNHGNWLPRRARQSGRIDADRSIGAFGIGASLFGSGARYDDLANTDRLAGYGLLDLRVSYAVNADWKVQFAANNVFDRHYETARWYAQPRRNYLLTFRYQPAH
ncbi:ligand-gated channel protein, partial [Xanthomonas euvesicatoria]